MPKAYVEIRTVAGYQGSVIRDIRNMKTMQPNGAVKDFDVILGDYDVLVVLEHKDPRVFHKALGEIARLAGVASTNSRVVMEPEYVDESLGPSSRPSGKGHLTT